MKRTAIIMAAAALLAAGCNERDIPEYRGGSYQIEVLCEDTPEYNMTKSMFTDNALTRVNGVNIWIYSDGVLDSAHSAYFSPASGISISFDRLDASYDIYMLANVGEVQGPKNEADVASWTYSFNDYGLFERDGFPMANTFLSFRPGSQATFKLKRLVGEYVIDIEDSSSLVSHTVKSVQLKNCALQVMPFGEDICCTEVSEEGDYLSLSDIATLNAGGQVSLYFLENLQGVLLPGNTDPKKKTPDNIADSEKRRRCTYIEMNTEADTPTAHYDSVRYRAYLGQDMTSDFNIRRSTRYFLTLDFEANMVRQEEWRIEPEEPEIVGALKWSQKELWITKSNTVIDDMYLDVICPDSRIDYTVEWDKAEATSAMCTITKSGTGRYRIHTDHPIDAYAPGSSTSLASVAAPSTKDVHVTVKSYDGLISDTATIHVVHECFPVRIYYDQTTRTMKAEAWHPCGQSLAFTLITCNVTGEGHYQKSGIAGDSWESASEQKAWSVERYTVSTTRNGATTHSLDKDATNSLNGVMNAIESHTVLYDNTWLGTNHNYYPMYPIAVNLKMSISACSQSGNQQGDITNPLATNCPFYLWNDPDNVVYNNRFQPFDQAFQTSHTGTFDVFLAGQDMRIKYYHSSGSTHAFYNGDTFHWHDSLPNGGVIAYEIRKEGSTYVCMVSGTRPRPVTLSVIGSEVGSQYTTHWKGGSRTEFR